MATKAKAKPKAKSSSRKRSTKKTESQFPQAFIANHRFPPETKVGFWPATDIGTERAQGQEPFPKPTRTATVKKDGTLSVAGLPEGPWCAAAEVDGRWLFLQFQVKANG